MMTWQEYLARHRDRFISQNRDLLACDLVMSADGLQLSPDQPKIEIGYRGIIADAGIPD